MMLSASNGILPKKKKKKSIVVGHEKIPYRQDRIFDRQN